MLDRAHKQDLFLRAVVQNDLLQAALYMDKEYVDTRIEDSDMLYPPICMAAAHGNTALVQLLIDHGADINQKDARQMTALHRITLKQDIVMLKFLVDLGADPNVLARYNATAFTICLEEDSREEIAYMLDHGVVNYTYGKCDSFNNQSMLDTVRSRYADAKNQNHAEDAEFWSSVQTKLYDHMENIMGWD